jgi:hypothetical protein
MNKESEALWEQIFKNPTYYLGKNVFVHYNSINIYEVATIVKIYIKVSSIVLRDANTNNESLTAKHFLSFNYVQGDLIFERE